MCFSFTNQENIMAATKHKFYKSKFNQTWVESYPVQGVSGDLFFQVTFFCIPCCKKLSCNHQGRKDVTDHCKKQSHLANVESSKKRSSMISLLTSNDSNLDEKVLNAELMVTNVLVQHNIALLTADHLRGHSKSTFVEEGEGVR